MLKKFVATLSIVMLLSPIAAFANQLSVTPVVIDDKAKSRDILKRSITIQNTSDQKLNIYPSVNDVLPEDGTAPFVSAQNAADKADSLANWIELSRGVIELSPGEEKTIPFVIRVAPNAIPGTYHASISLGWGTDRAMAESRTPLGTVTVNVEVGEDVKEFLQLNKFWTDRVFFSGDDVLFNFQLENIGNQQLQPKGEIRIYNRKGEEVASLEVNGDGRTFTPDQQLQLASVWSAASGFGKYKAFLNVDYGSSQVASVQDTVYFWIIPWQQLVLMIVVSLGAVVALAVYYHRWLEEKHREKFGFAPAGSANVNAEGREPLRNRLIDSAGAVLSPITAMASFLIGMVRRAPKSMHRAERVSEPLQKAEQPSPRIDEPPRAILETLSAQEPAVRPAPTAPGYGEVIDLKKMRQTQMAPEVSAHGEVINLKKRS